MESCSEEKIIKVKEHKLLNEAENAISDCGV
jgi:hypothetical protein